MEKIERKRCAFHKGSTNNDGKKQAPDICRQAILDRFKVEVERCAITNPEECPLKRFYPMVEQKVA